jgi:hypothetical protein
MWASNMSYRRSQERNRRLKNFIMKLRIYMVLVLGMTRKKEDIQNILAVAGNIKSILKKYQARKHANIKGI